MAGRSDKRSNVRVRALMATTGEGLIALDKDAVVRLMNEAAEEMIGLSRKAVVGNPVESLGVPELATYTARKVALRSRNRVT
jgi:PAS domain S-box-containing protein